MPTAVAKNNHSKLRSSKYVNMMALPVVQKRKVKTNQTMFKRLTMSFASAHRDEKTQKNYDEVQHYKKQHETNMSNLQVRVSRWIKNYTPQPKHRTER